MLKEAPWNVSLAELHRQLGVSERGLSSAEAERRLRVHGANDVFDHHARPLWRDLLDRLSNPLVLILLFAASLSALTGETASFALIVAIVGMSVALDLYQQRRAEHSIEALRLSVAVHATVVRDGRRREIHPRELVPGDVIALSAGDVVPADCRLLAARDLFVDQALMTGESFPVEKSARDLDSPVETPASAADWLSTGTSVVSGTATALVCRTGRSTELGVLAGTLARRRPPDAFEIGIRRFGNLMLRLTILLVLFVLAANVLFDRPWLQSLLFALALAVGLTPELLPMVVTVTLANGARRMAAKRVVVKRLAAIHDLGAMDVLATDKTGTLTENRIELVRHIDAAGVESPRVLMLGKLNSQFETGLRSPLDEAILAHGGNSELEVWQKIDEVPFDFERRRVSVLADDGASRLLVVKGAPEDLIALSTAAESAGGERRPLDEDARARLHAAFERLGEDGYRVLAVACREMERDRASAAVGDENGLTFAGFLAFVDPPKRSAAAAIAALARSGVDVKVLSGDNERITRHVCAELGLPVNGVITGPMLAELSPDALRARLATTTLFCRVTPQQKERVLLALKHNGNVVGFLGDGINDAPALHAADVGLSVDTATDVAKEAADIVLLERDLAVVHAGVMEGRRTVENVTKYILMGSSSNFGNMFSMAAAALFLPFLPMLPVQVLLNNLLYDISEIGVPFDNVDDEAVARPTHWDMQRIERFMLVLGPVSSIFDLLTFVALIHLFGAGEKLFQTGWFIESLATQALVIFVIRTRGAPWRSTPHPILTGLAVGVVLLGLLIPVTPLAAAFGFVAPPLAFYLFVLVATLSYLALVELVKRVLLRNPTGADQATGRVLRLMRDRGRRSR